MDFTLHHLCPPTQGHLLDCETYLGCMKEATVELTYIMIDLNEFNVASPVSFHTGPPAGQRDLHWRQSGGHWEWRVPLRPAHAFQDEACCVPGVCACVCVRCVVCGVVRQVWVAVNCATWVSGWHEHCVIVRMRKIVGYCIWCCLRFLGTDEPL